MVYTKKDVAFWQIFKKEVFPLSLKNIVGNNVKKHRIPLSLSQEEFANRVGVSVSYLRDIEHGRANPTLEMLSRIAEGFDIAPSALLGTEENEGSDMEIISKSLLTQIQYLQALPPEKRFLFLQLFDQLLHTLYDVEEA